MITIDENQCSTYRATRGRMRLGALLKSSRLKRGLTLRDLERETGISNGYLSQLESDTIKQPSPRHLHRLSHALSLAYGELMGLAGYAMEQQVSAKSDYPSHPSFLGLEELNEADKRKIQAYIDDLRDARRVRGS